MFTNVKLTFKLTLCYIITIILLIFGWAGFGTSFFEHHLSNDANVKLYEEARMINDNYMSGYYDNMLSNDNFRTQLKMLSKYLNSRIIVARNDGTLLIDTEGKQKANLFDFETDTLSQTFTHNATLPGLVDDNFQSVSYPITYEMRLRGYILILKYSKDIYAEANALNNSYWPYVLAFAIIITIAYIVIYYITIIPTKHTLKAALEYTNHNYDYTYKIKSNDEFGDIHDALMCIAGDLNNLESYQKNFIANISHDFRSPLTSIRGYAEAMSDGTIPPELYSKYLGIIQFETERLTKLTSNLLELNNYDNKGTLLDISEFNINQTIKHTAESFEGTCTKKQIRVVLEFDDVQTIVSADMGKIQQVLYNLLDNAIKFSPQNSIIKITTELKSEKVFISVKDHGIGIPKDSLNKVWERFYKTDFSRGKDKKGTGLGLSITKEIINAHGENINVTSTINVGTEFSFSLPVKSV